MYANNLKSPWLFCQFYKFIQSEDINGEHDTKHIKDQRSGIKFIKFSKFILPFNAEYFVNTF